MKALIIAGGIGSRSSKFKLFSNILGKPLIDYYKTWLNEFDIYVNVNKNDAEKLKGIEGIHLEIEEKRLGNATAVRNFALKYKEDFVCIHNDIFTNLNFGKFVKQIQKKDKQFVAILLSKNISRPRAFGIITFSQDKKVLSLTRQRYVNCGVYYFKSDIAKYIEEDTFQDLDRHVFPKMISEGKLGVFTFSGLWYDIGTDQKQDIINTKLKERKQSGDKK